MPAAAKFRAAGRTCRRRPGSECVRGRRRGGGRRAGPSGGGHAHRTPRGARAQWSAVPAIDCGQLVDHLETTTLPGCH
eukprot:4814578-Alexandrium_andersonii.AAC.1